MAAVLELGAVPLTMGTGVAARRGLRGAFPTRMWLDETVSLGKELLEDTWLVPALICKISSITWFNYIPPSQVLCSSEWF